MYEKCQMAKTFRPELIQNKLSLYIIKSLNLYY